MRNSIMILSAERFGLSAMENLQRTTELEGCLDRLGAGYKEVQGCYQGNRESSFVVVLPSFPTYREELYNALLGLAADFEQDTVLVVHANDHAAEMVTLKDRAGKIIGTFEVDNNADDDYTFDPDSGQYWVIK